MDSQIYNRILPHVALIYFDITGHLMIASIDVLIIDSNCTSHIHLTVLLNRCLVTALIENEIL